MLTHAVWWAADYAYVVHRQLRAWAGRRRGAAYLVPDERVDPDVVVVPGVYETWAFLEPLVRRLHAHGHCVHVLPELGYNRRPVVHGAQVLGRYLEAQDLRDVVVLAHSKGGLIGKLAMLRHDPEGRVAAMVAVATPFGGSALARWVPVPGVRAFLPQDPTLLALAAERAVDARIVSAYSRFDPHIPGGSHLEGARNVVLRTPGHFRVLTDPELADLVLRTVPGAGEG